MKTYADFISDLPNNTAILGDLNKAIPFNSQEDLVSWFDKRGYYLSSIDAEMLFNNQTSLMSETEQINY